MYHLPFSFLLFSHVFLFCYEHDSTIRAVWVHVQAFSEDTMGTASEFSGRMRS